MNRRLAVIGGTGLEQMAGHVARELFNFETPFGDPSNHIAGGELNGHPLIFMARHGNPHRIPPHLVNYRANIWALQHLEVTQIIAVNAVGSIRRDLQLSDLVLCDQIIDYTHSRAATYFDDSAHHIDFTYPFDEPLRRELIKAANSLAEIHIVDNGCYGATQGPRLETAAEIVRMDRDGCHVVGMTGMPEAALARELGIPYAMVSMVVNKAAGLDGEVVKLEEISSALKVAVQRVIQLVGAFVSGDN